MGHEEQYLLELVNETRLDPLGSAGRYLASYAPLKTRNDPTGDIQGALDYFRVSGPDLLAQYAALTPVQPVAADAQLAAAARGHSGAMIAADAQEHVLPGEAGLGQRVTAQGYGWTALGENIFAYGTSLLQAHAAFMVDWGAGPGGIQSPPGHRNTILNGALREVGLAVVPEANAGTSVGPLVITQDFGTRPGTGSIVLGVAYADADRDGFYSIGEGTGGLTVAVAGRSAVSEASGGYALPTGTSGTLAITLSGAGLAGPVRVSAASAGGAGSNVKLDVVDGSILRISTSAVISGPVAQVQGIGVRGLDLAVDDGAHTLMGTVGADTLTGGAGADWLRGGLGDDVLAGRGGDDVVFGNQGADLVFGNLGADTLYGGQDADSLFGGQGDDLVLGNLGADLVFGNLGADRLFGGQGGDTLYGGQGDDLLSGDLGDDVLQGDLGADRYVFGESSGRDLVLGFSRADGDRLDFAGQGYGLGSAPNGDALFTLSGGGTVQLAGVTVAALGTGFLA